MNFSMNRCDRETALRLSIYPLPRTRSRAPEVDHDSKTVSRPRCKGGVPQGRIKTATGRAPKNRFVEYFSRFIKSVTIVFPWSIRSPSSLKPRANLSLPFPPPSFLYVLLKIYLSPAPSTFQNSPLRPTQATRGWQVPRAEWRRAYVPSDLLWLAGRVL